ncbi:MAG TPA: ribonuclease P protein component [Gemmatimonadaceae bacterium]
MPKRRRLTRSVELQTVIREGKRIRARHLDVRILASPRSYSRIGLVVPRYGHSAVARNTLKRRLREIVRIDILPLLDAPIDVVVRTRAEAYDAPISSLAAELKRIRDEL